MQKNQRPLKQTTIKDAHRLLAFMNNAFDDYLASRLLFNNNKLLQACFLANTSIEKYFKAMIIARGNTSKKTHNLPKLWQSFNNYAPTVAEEVNIDFLRQLSKIYESRYFSDLPIGYNIVIIKNKYLAELDFVFNTFYQKIEIRSNASELVLKYQNALEDQEDILYRNNYTLNSFDKTTFVERADIVYELRVATNGEIFEAQYPTEESKNDGFFNYIGLKEDHTSKLSLKMSHKLMVRSNTDNI